MNEETPKPKAHPAQIREASDKETETEPTSTEVVPDDNLKNLTQLVYILQAVSLVVGVTAIAGLIINYLKRDEVKGTYLEARFTWQIKTFWYALLGVILRWLLVIVVVSFLILGAVCLWFIYLIVKV
ncbi:MAG: putative membrane protein [Porticoccus sp.]|jgi:uncharacterized membrane protein